MIPGTEIKVGLESSSYLGLKLPLKQINAENDRYGNLTASSSVLTIPQSKKASALST